MRIRIHTKTGKKYDVDLDGGVPFEEFAFNFAESTKETSYVIFGTIIIKSDEIECLHKIGPVADGEVQHDQNTR